MSMTSTPDFDLEFKEVTDNATKDAPVASLNDGPKIPEKYQDKSIEDIIRMHQESEKRASRLANEVGEVRRMADALLELKKPDQRDGAQKPVPPLTADDLFSDPNAALTRTIEGSTVAKQVDETQKKLEQLEIQVGRKEFETKYPTFRDDTNDPAFQDWIKRNPARLHLLMQADKFDFGAANALWDMWDEHKELASVQEKQKAAARDKQGRFVAAQTVKASAIEAVEDNTKPIISRVKLMDLRTRSLNGDPRARAKYESPEFQAEMAQAYAEGRVR